MDSDTKVATIWGTSIMLTVAVLGLMASSCVRDQNLKEQTFAAKCVQTGHKYVPTHSDTLGACV